MLESVIGPIGSLKRAPAIVNTVSPAPRLTSPAGLCLVACSGHGTIRPIFRWSSREGASLQSHGGGRFIAPVVQQRSSWPRNVTQPYGRPRRPEKKRSQGCLESIASLNNRLLGETSPGHRPAATFAAGGSASARESSASGPIPGTTSTAALLATRLGQHEPQPLEFEPAHSHFAPGYRQHFTLRQDHRVGGGEVGGERIGGRCHKCDSIRFAAKNRHRSAA